MAKRSKQLIVTLEGDWDRLERLLGRSEEWLFRAIKASIAEGCKYCENALTDYIKSGSFVKNKGLTIDIRRFQGWNLYPPLVSTEKLLDQVTHTVLETATKVAGVTDVHGLIGTRRKRGRINIAKRIHNGFTIKWTRAMLWKVFRKAGYITDDNWKKYAKYVNTHPKIGTTTRVKPRPFVKNLIKQTSFRSRLFKVMYTAFAQHVSQEIAAAGG